MGVFLEKKKRGVLQKKKVLLKTQTRFEKIIYFYKVRKFLDDVSGISSSIDCSSCKLFVVQEIQVGGSI